MTLCIAALCVDRDSRHSAVIAVDKRIETDIASAETEQKIIPLPHAWTALIAGPVYETRELVDLYDTLLRDNAIQDATLALEQLRVPPRILRRRLADAVTHRRVPMSYDEFLTNGKAQLPDDLFGQVAYEIFQQQIQAEIILIAPLRDGLHLFLCRNGEVFNPQHFAVIGSGTTVPEPVLYQRELESITQLDAALYIVYEAKRLSEIAPGVGRETTVAVKTMPIDIDKGMTRALHEWTWHHVRKEGLQLLDRAFKSFGPKPTFTVFIPLKDILPSLPQHHSVPSLEQDAAEDDPGSAESGRDEQTPQ